MSDEQNIQPETKTSLISVLKKTFTMAGQVLRLVLDFALSLGPMILGFKGIIPGTVVFLYYAIVLYWIYENSYDFPELQEEALRDSKTCFAVAWGMSGIWPTLFLLAIGSWLVDSCGPKWWKGAFLTHGHLRTTVYFALTITGSIMFLNGLRSVFSYLS